MGPGDLARQGVVVERGPQAGSQARAWQGGQEGATEPQACQGVEEGEAEACQAAVEGEPQACLEV